MPTYKRKKMCRECPFRAAAPPGWLGPWLVEEVEEVEEIIRVDDDLICHVDVNKRLAEGEVDRTGIVNKHHDPACSLYDRGDAGP